MNRTVLSYLLLFAFFGLVFISPPGAIFVEGTSRAGCLAGLIISPACAVASWRDRTR
jgi:hypothetical protein